MPNELLPHDHGPELDGLREHIPGPGEFHTLADLFRLLGDGSRLRIFWVLCHGEACVMNLSALMEMSSPAVSHHLKQLKAAGLVVSRRGGKEVYYRAARTDEARALHDATERLMSISCPMNGRETD